MTKHETSANGCPICALGMSEALEIVSRHRTTTGTVVYARCECGRLSMWLEPTATVRGTPMLGSLADVRAPTAGQPAPCRG